MSRPLLLVPIAGVLLVSGCAGVGLGSPAVTLDGFPEGVADALIEGTLNDQTQWFDEYGSGTIHLVAADGSDAADRAAQVDAAFDAAGLAVVDTISTTEFAPGIQKPPTRVADGYLIEAWGSEASSWYDSRPGVVYRVTETGLPAATFTQYDDIIGSLATARELSDYGEYWSVIYLAQHPDGAEADCNSYLLEADAALVAGGLQPEEVIDPTWFASYSSYRYGDVEIQCGEPWGDLTGEPGWNVTFTIEIPKP